MCVQGSEFFFFDRVRSSACDPALALLQQPSHTSVQTYKTWELKTCPLSYHQPVSLRLDAFMRVFSLTDLLLYHLNLIVIIRTWSTMSFILRIILLLVSLATTAMAHNTERFNVTAIGAVNGSSTIECWQIARPFDLSTDPGTAGTKAVQLGDVSNITLSILPPRFDGGLHRAPFVQ